MSELLQIIGVSFKPSAGGSQLILYLGEKGLVTTVRAKLGKLLQNLENSCKTWKTLAKLGKLQQNLEDSCKTWKTLAKLDKLDRI